MLKIRFCHHRNLILKYIKIEILNEIIFHKVTVFTVFQLNKKHLKCTCCTVLCSPVYKPVAAEWSTKQHLLLSNTSPNTKDSCHQQQALATSLYVHPTITALVYITAINKPLFKSGLHDKRLPFTSPQTEYIASQTASQYKTNAKIPPSLTELTL